jgi:hypothetical protein
MNEQASAGPPPGRFVAAGLISAQTTNRPPKPRASPRAAAGRANRVALSAGQRWRHRL